MRPGSPETSPLQPPSPSPVLVSLNLSPGGIPKLPVPRARLAADGFEGDGRAHAKHIKPTRAVSLLDEEVLYDLRAEGYDVCPGALGENLTVRGLGLQSLPNGTRLRFAGGIEIEIVEPRKPCFVLDSVHPDLKTVTVGRIGAMARVITEGFLSPGATIEVIAAKAEA